jgi:metal-sulfur cluster biosynthetic enzyme
MPSKVADRRLSRVWEVLRGVVDPCSIATGVPIDLVEMGLIKEVSIEGDEAVVELQLTSPVCMQVSNIRQAVEDGADQVEGIRAIRCEFDADSDWMPEMISSDARRRLREVRPVRSPTDGARKEKRRRSQIGR